MTYQEHMHFFFQCFDDFYPADLCRLLLSELWSECPHHPEPFEGMNLEEAY